MRPAEPRSEADLISRAERIAGLTIGDLAVRTGRRQPRDLRRHKGWVGELLEYTLGASATSRPVPDFEKLGVELKTIPVNQQGLPRESTHVCAAQLRDLIGQQWKTSTVYLKLRRVLWIPIEADPAVRLGDRHVGRPLLWSPSESEERTLREDWEELAELITTGRIEDVDARLGTYLQLRPKAANSRALAPASDATGAPAQTLPRGFYLRPSFTRMVLGRHAAR